MKKSAFALISSLLLGTAAHAQSSVTLYGVIDEGLTYTSNTGGHSAWQLAGSDIQGNRWGLRGNEDLGGGLAAQFVLESGFNLSNGTFQQGGRLFGRQAYVGLSSNRWGTVTLGRQYDPLISYVATLTSNGGWGGLLFTHPLDNDNMDDFYRINNAVKYASPDIAGLTFGSMYAFSNSTGFADNRAWSVAARYTHGPFTLAAGYMDMTNPGTSCGGAVAGGTAAACGVTGDATFTAAKQRIFASGAGYSFGPAIFNLTYTNSYVGNAVSPSAYQSSSLRFNNIEFNARYSLTASLMLGAMYDYTNFTKHGGAGNPSGHWNEFGVLADYLLSKRTDVYFQGVHQRGSGVTANILGSAGASSSGIQTVARIGLRHRF
ncbi:porin [Paraburkholderia sp. ZP32-5]|uniref:porin n=1 Tax=Paraburkholderia sp. ZP32-5 TaxID=2883245 RepID=UPI001F22F972|nr:porin [Paraburkholderia sp. ZP32-5]